MTADEALDVLRRTAQVHNRKLREIAEYLALTHKLPPGVGVASPDLLAIRWTGHAPNPTGL